MNKKNQRQRALRCARAAILQARTQIQHESVCLVAYMPQPTYLTRRKLTDASPRKLKLRYRYTCRCQYRPYEERIHMRVTQTAG